MSMSRNNNSKELSYSKGSISFGEFGVEQTYIPPIYQDKNKNKKLKKAKIPQNIKKNSDKKNKGNVYIYNKNFNISINNSFNNSNNNSNNSSDKSNHNSDDDDDKKCDKVAQVPDSKNSNDNNNQNNFRNNLSDSNKANAENPFFNAPKKINVPLQNNHNNIILSNQNQNYKNNIHQNHNNNKNNYAHNKIINNNNIIHYQYQKERNERKIFNQLNQFNNINISRYNEEIPFLLPNPKILNIEDNTIFSRYEKPSLTGLINLGQTSYLNSLLQLLCSIRPFVNFFFKLRNYFEKNLEYYPLSYYLYRLCTHIYPEDNKKEKYDGSNILTTLGGYNLVYNDNYYEKNPNECIYFILSKLNDELGINNNSNFNLIYNYFTWIKVEEMKCQKCPKVSKYYPYFQTFDLNITEVAKYDKSRKIKIKNCIDFYNTIPISKKNYCSKCKKYEQMVSQTFICFYPKIFVFILDLKKNRNINFIIEPKIFLGEKPAQITYVLNGIVFYDSKKNKYNALCCSPVDKMWYLYDDEDVQEMKLETFIHSYNKNTNGYLPCVLVYIKC